MAVVFHRKEINCDDIWQFQFLDSVKNLVDDVYDVFMTFMTWWMKFMTQMTFSADWSGEIHHWNLILENLM